MGKKSFCMPIKINIHRTVRTRKKDNHRVHQAQELGYLRHGTNGRLNFFSTERLAKARARFFAASQLHSTTKCPLWNGLLLLAEILSLPSSSSIVPQIKLPSSNWRREECVQVDKKVIHQMHPLPDLGRPVQHGSSPNKQKSGGASGRGLLSEIDF